MVHDLAHALTHDTLSGPVNAVSPAPVTNFDFTQILAQAMHRPSALPMPRFLLELLFGEMSREVLLSSTRVHPQKLIDTDFPFRFPDLAQALRQILR